VVRLDVLDGDDGLIRTGNLFLIVPPLVSHEGARKDTNAQNDCRDCCEHKNFPLFGL
jgi:hypothetical protein